MNPDRYYQNYIKNLSQPINDANDSKLVLTDSDADEASYGFNLAGGVRVKEIDNDFELFPFLNDFDESELSYKRDQR